jgi:hypothetical protein
VTAFDGVMAKKKQTDGSTSRITRAPKSAAPKAARKRTRLTDEAIAEFVVPGVTTEVPPPETSWSPVETIHLEELVVEAEQVEAVASTQAPAAFTPVGREIPWLPPSAASLLGAALARFDRKGLVARLLERGRPVGEKLLGRVSQLLERFGVRRFTSYLQR